MISLLTLTGDRPQLFARCERYMARQTCQRSWQWVVVDDGFEPTRCTQGQELLRLTPGKPPKESFSANLRAGLAACTGDFVFVIEDDDWYGENHISRLLEPLDTYDLVGEADAKYYHVGQRLFRPMGNRRHASLCQTAFRRHVIPAVLSRLETPFVDMRLWHAVSSRFLFPESKTCVGLKGQVGRDGIGCGHRPRGNWLSDPSGVKLRQWIGEEDAREVLECVPSC